MADKPLPNIPFIQKNLSSLDSIVQSLSPLIAVTSSADVDEICRANNIPTFADFIKPFGRFIDGRGK